ncbi:MAG: 7-carboxy-7-deazaguanine synthase QueE [Gammaproteobacteria bacterium]|nr:7-carboxy-7-deazaguanine synthase QueE [Gammaproteobacteria bacterium]
MSTTAAKRGDAPARPEREALEQVRVTEVFHSLQGEGRTAGWPTVFVRLTGCPLRCTYCDTAYAFHGGEPVTVAEVVERASGYGARYATVTGGEPMAQRHCPGLLAALADAGYEVSLETSGALDLSAVDPRVVKVMDLKTPGSGECHRNRYENIDLLGPRDQVKLVIRDRADYDWARGIVARYRLDARCEVLLSPSHGELAPGTLGDWILADRLPVRLQIQLHKYLWGDVPGR